MGEVTTLIWWQNLIISVSFQPRRQNLLIIQRENELICHFCFDMNSMTLIFTFNIFTHFLFLFGCLRAGEKFVHNILVAVVHVPTEKNDGLV